MKRVYCLYRVSTMGQVEKNDIPMQKRACEEFCKKMGWDIIESHYEKGISGYKISANNRDAIVDIKNAATKEKFDILLVYMFDRLGRREDETPFIVQWFINNGIEVWSVTEGQQKMEQHIDKLLNYIRFWQAQGESEKTSIRVKSAHAQLVQDGYFRGGVVAFGYKLEHKGRFNKKGIPLGDLVINEKEAIIVRIIFDRYVNHGYGTQRICSYLADVGLTPRTGERFVNTTIQNMIKRRLYIGILSSGDIQSNIFPALQIVSQEVFNKAQEIAQGRSTKYTERRIPLNTRGNALLSGNIFCGHCGGRLTLTTNGKKYCRKNGDVTIIPKLRYVCYNKTRHPDRCNGQTGYTTHKLDTMIDDVLQKFFSKVKEKSDRQSISMHLKREIGLSRAKLEISKAELKRELQTLSALEDELINVIQGKSAFKPEILDSKYSNTKINIESKQLEISILEMKIANKDDFMSRIAKQHEDALNLANMYSIGGIDEKKMIVIQFIKEIRISRGYELEMDFEAKTWNYIFKHFYDN